MLKEPETEETVVFFVTFLSLVTFQLEDSILIKHIETLNKKIAKRYGELEIQINWKLDLTLFHHVKANVRN